MRLAAGLLDNRTVLEKADLALADLTAGGGLLQPAQAQKFIRILIDESVILPHKPSTYFRRNVMVGAAFPAPSDAKIMPILGVDRIMWGSDYPHMEACSPHSPESLRRTFEGWEPNNLKLVLSENAARVYGFDLDALAPMAAKCGPTVAELAAPLETVPDNQSPAFSRP